MTSDNVGLTMSGASSYSVIWLRIQMIGLDFDKLSADCDVNKSKIKIKRL